MTLQIKSRSCVRRKESFTVKMRAESGCDKVKICHHNTERI